jgi:glycine cleavage system transcriptional repressor
VRDVAISAVGADRPGIVAAITEALFALGGNLADCRAALLRGSFAMVVAASVPDEVDDAALHRVLDQVANELGLGLWLGAAGPAAVGKPKPRAVVSVYGADHPGIVKAVTRELARLNVNVVDLSSRLVGDPALYLLAIEAELPPGLDARALQAALRPVANGQRVDLSVAEHDDEVM